MSLATAYVLLSLAQPPGVQSDPALVWPPVERTAQRYRARLHKTRSLSDELAAAERRARKAAGLPAPPANPRQSVALEMDIELLPGADDVTVRYATRLTAAAGLRISVQPETRGDLEAAAPPLRNDRIDAVWGFADDRKQAPLSLPRAAVERSFEQRFRRGPGGVQRAEFGALFGDHLLPVLWDQPLPCWTGHMAAVLELAGEPAVEGKTLIRDGSGSFPLGHRETRVELAFTKVSGGGFSFRYKVKVRQVVTRTRDLAAAAPPFDWKFEIDGEADYVAGEQGFERVREEVRGWPEGLGEDRVQRVRDEAFEGSIEIERVREPPGRPRR